MSVKTVSTKPYLDQKPGTAGLRKKTKVFEQENYLENFVQSIFDVILPTKTKGPFVVSGDGRYFSERALPIILRMAQANGIENIIIGRGGILSSPAASHVIRKYKAWGGLLLTASHNPGGPEGDFGLKVEGSHGGGVREDITNAIFERTKTIVAYKILDTLDETKITTIDPVMDYADLMESLFDFKRLHHFVVGSGWKFCFDALHAVAGPYAQEIFEERLGCSRGSVIHKTPLPDFGGGHPEPNPEYATDFVKIMMDDDGPQFGSAWDGDADRNLIYGEKFFVSPSDSLAIMLSYAHLIPAYKDGMSGVARTIPTTPAVDQVAKDLKIPCYVTPTGWKYFGNLLEAGRITLCGEESFGSGSHHIREKDGIWATLMWLSIVANMQKSIPEIVRDHWARYGRYTSCRYDYFVPEAHKAKDVMSGLLNLCGTIPELSHSPYAIEKIEEFIYDDPVDNSTGRDNTIVITLVPQARILCRLSGTDSAGATLRVYFEKYQAPGEIDETAGEVPWKEMHRLAEHILNIGNIASKVVYHQT